MKRRYVCLVVAGLAASVLAAAGVCAASAPKQTACATCTKPACAKSTCAKQTCEKATCKKICPGEAKRIALAHAGLTEDGVRRFSWKLDREDGILVYEIEFKANGFEYEYEVNAVTGAIVKAEKERD